MYKKLFELYINFNPNFDFYTKLYPKRHEECIYNEIDEINARLRFEVIEKGGKIKNIELRYLGKNKENRTVVSSDHIKVMNVPSDLILSKFHPKISQFCLENKIPTDNSYDCLLSFLLFEEIKKEKDEKLSLIILENYFDSLPKDFSEFPLNYKKEELFLLKYTFFLKRLEKLKTEYETNFEQISKYFLAMNAEFEKDKFMKFYLILCSRSFGLDTEEGTFDSLVPYGDMFNTSINDFERSSFWYFDDDKNFHVEAGRDIKSSEEIFIRYNDGYNSDFLLYYGFTLKDNKNGKIENFEIKDENGDFLFDVSLKYPKPSLRDFKLDKLKDILKKIDADDDLDCLQLIAQNLLSALKLYENHCQFSNKHIRFIDNINLLNIKRIYEEEQMVIKENLKFIENIIHFIKNQGRVYDFKFEDLSYYDLNYLHKYKLYQSI